MQFSEGVLRDGVQGESVANDIIPFLFEIRGAEKIGRRQFLNRSAFLLSMLPSTSGYSNSSRLNSIESQMENVSAYDTLDEWYQTPALTDKSHGIYSQMKQVSAGFRGIKTFSDKTEAVEAMGRLADSILSTVGNPIPSPLRAALKFPEGYGLDEDFTRMFSSLLYDNSENYPVRAMPGRVSAHMLLSEYIPQNTGLQFRVTDRAMKRELSQLQVDCSSHALAEIIASICTTTGMDMATLPFDPEDVAKSKFSVELRLCRQRPFAQLTYATHQGVVTMQGRYVMNDDEISFHCIGDNGTDMPEKIIVFPSNILVQEQVDDHICIHDCCEVCAVNAMDVVCVPILGKDFVFRDARSNTRLVAHDDGSFSFRKIDGSVLPENTRNIVWSTFDDSLFIDHWAIRGAKIPLKFSKIDAKRFRES